MGALNTVFGTSKESLLEGLHEVEENYMNYLDEWEGEEDVEVTLCLLVKEEVPEGELGSHLENYNLSGYGTSEEEIVESLRTRGYQLLDQV